MTKAYDALIIGAGHNGLVCAFYLAKAGLKVRIVEARDVVGGAAVTEEFAPGFRNSVASYTVSLLNPKVIRDLRLHEARVRHVVVQRAHDEVAVLPRAFLVAVALEAVGVGVAHEVEPVAAPRLAVVRAGEQAVDQALVRVG